MGPEQTSPMVKQQKERSALELARALKRYNRMRPEKAYVALNREWPPKIAAMIEPVMWGKVELDGRSVMDIARETKALMDKAARAYVAVQKAKCSGTAYRGGRGAA
jgi:hypothetical protein